MKFDDQGSHDDATPALPPASEGMEIWTDYRMGFTPGRHPLPLLCDRLVLDRLLSA
ncbi:hypothetical protein BDI4_660004 [Burkholderia diffusa]|uniref:hypothetical protein n=1 Tax=Burkholderia diffusa TaxID=488732 RepID=UPI001CAF8DB7|nr:hypothetical protein [Burkholderia diffusa]CAG9260839.1 hypothetical protein BDI4_660004 [Burkholderia diffusa]